MLIFSKIILFFLFFTTSTLQIEEYCEIDDMVCKGASFKQNYRYLFYDVNPPEGFNLRRDVYMRYAIWAHKLVLNSRLEYHKYVKLVLPPWSRLYHWRYSEKPELKPWSYYFDLESLQKFAPVIEMYQFFDDVKKTGSNKVLIDEVYILQHYEDMFQSGKFIEKMSIEKCNEPVDPNYFYYKNITSNNVKCLSFHGFTDQLTNLFETSSSKTFLFIHGEVVLHSNFGDKLYWKCRRSMRFNKHLINIANEFRNKNLNSTDVSDKTELPEDWKEEKPRRTALGGPYLSVHLRRGDFVRARPKDTPTISHAAKQIKNRLIDLSINKVFVATDAKINEINELKSILESDGFQVLLFEPNKNVLQKFGDGGVAIIEQIICSYSRYFIGTYESTFSFRIQEEREIIGFPVESTFNRFCGGDSFECEPPSKWKIVY
nr:GDP-fucose protein O-fucosyltransferase 2 [Onthophagus taurus]